MSDTGLVSGKGLVYTVRERCRVCYTCVRECPVKAIKIINGQAEVIASRCIGCGNCTRVCSQNAKVFVDNTYDVEKLLAETTATIALVAPSFAAEFTDLDDYRILPGMLKMMGFDKVVEVAFGADLVAREYGKILQHNNGNHSISTDCPAIMYYIRHYHPQLVDSLAPVVSPMVATVRVIREMYGKDVNTCFIGPCIAKKAESDEVDTVITFRELRKMFLKNNIHPWDAIPVDFDEPRAGKASIFPVTRGKLNSIDELAPNAEDQIIVASGRVPFRDAVREFENGLNHSQHLELLCCDGCIMGPGMSESGKLFSKTAKIKSYVRQKLETMDEEDWKQNMQKFSRVDLSKDYKPADRRIPVPSKVEINELLTRMGKSSPSDQLNCGACGYDTCMEHAAAILEGLAEPEMCLPYTIEKLHKSISELNISNEKLANAQMSLKHSEKLANMGQLSAGIAHELNNPLGVITMYSNILLDEAGQSGQMADDLKLIVEQADRCKKIVGGLLNFARKNQVHQVPLDVVEFVRHSLGSIVIPTNIKVVVDPRIADPVAEIDHDQWMQVLTNLEKNAIEAMPDGGSLTIHIEGNDEEVEFKICDNGTGISKENMEKMFTPFFTTKPIGKGTGLGLPLIYGIVKMHHGNIHVDSNADLKTGPTGTCFNITIPRRKKTN